eukprot:scaffold122566_cov40-Cyclotella_meneghiniana.AAC.1
MMKRSSSHANAVAEIVVDLWTKLGRVEDSNFCPRRHDKTPHARMACDPVKRCQLCYYNQDEDNGTGT